LVLLIHKKKKKKEEEVKVEVKDEEEESSLQKSLLRKRITMSMIATSTSATMISSSINKQKLLLSVLFVILALHLHTIDTQPISVDQDNVQIENDGANDDFVLRNKRSINSNNDDLRSKKIQDQNIVNNQKYSSASSRFRNNNNLKTHNLPANFFKSTGSPSHHRQRLNKKLKLSPSAAAAIDNRLKRFRMLDPEEFHEMLKSMSQLSQPEQSKTMNGGVDTIGMELENYWSRK